jgi:nitronate monooxygenase
VRTPLCDLLGIDAPIVQAPMGGAAGPELAAAVSNAGALGTLPLWSAPPEDVAAAVARTRELTDRPFAVNLLLHLPQEERLRAAIDAGARIFAFGWGAVTTPLAQVVHDADGIVLAAVGDVDEAPPAVAAGADAIVAQGWEAGGHVWGSISTLALVPPVVDAVAPVPVVAAGGIADGRGVAAVLALGAAGAWVGTRFLLAEETAAHAEYKERLLRAGAGDAVHTGLFDVGWPDAPHRALRNSTLEAWERAGRPASGKRPGEGEEVARRGDGTPIARYASSTPSAGTTGEIEAMSLWAGQGVGLVRRAQPAAEIVRELVDEAEAVLRDLP